MLKPARDNLHFRFAQRLWVHSYGAVYMMLGQASATAAVLSIDGNSSVQDVPYQELRKQLLNDGQILVPGK